MNLDIINYLGFSETELVIGLVVLILCALTLFAGAFGQILAIFFINRKRKKEVDDRDSSE